MFLRCAMNWWEQGMNCSLALSSGDVIYFSCSNKHSAIKTNPPGNAERVKLSVLK